MRSNPALAFFCVAAAACGPCWSQTTTPAAPGPSKVFQVEERVDRNEPVVKHTVIEDEGSKIDELRERGQVTHVVVTPKVGTSVPYEIIVGRSGREPLDGTGGANSAVGKRVWNVLAF